MGNPIDECFGGILHTEQTAAVADKHGRLITSLDNGAQEAQQ
jgi:hypothetical protein